MNRFRSRILVIEDIETILLRFARNCRRLLMRRFLGGRIFLGRNSPISAGEKKPRAGLRINRVVEV